MARRAFPRLRKYRFYRLNGCLIQTHSTILQTINVKESEKQYIGFVAENDKRHFSRYIYPNIHGIFVCFDECERRNTIYLLLARKFEVVPFVDGSIIYQLISRTLRVFVGHGEPLIWFYSH